RQSARLIVERGQNKWPLPRPGDGQAPGKMRPVLRQVVAGRSFQSWILKPCRPRQTVPRFAGPAHKDWRETNEATLPCSQKLVPLRASSSSLPASNNVPDLTDTLDPPDQSLFRV